MAEVPFSQPVRAKLGAPIPEFTKTVVDAIDAVFDLKKGIENRPHWQAALLALWSAHRDDGDDPSKIISAESAFRDALAAEGWLNDSHP